jgi:hypothetical protein
MSNLKILGVYYTHSQVFQPLKLASVNSVEKMIANTPDSKVVYSVWEYMDWIPEEKQQRTYFRHNGHMNIALQIYRILLTNPEYEYVAFLEHDVLYYENYLNDLRNNIKDGYYGISWRSYCGMNANGFQKVNQRDEPMSMLSMKYQSAVDLMKNRIDYYTVNGAGCIEPDDKSGLLWVEGEENVHVNMNETDHSHHLTSHYNIYSKTDIFNPHPYWGDYKQFGIF